MANTTQIIGINEEEIDPQIMAELADVATIPPVGEWGAEYEEWLDDCARNRLAAEGAEL